MPQNQYITMLAEFILLIPCLNHMIINPGIFSVVGLCSNATSLMRSYVCYLCVFLLIVGLPPLNASSWDLYPLDLQQCLTHRSGPEHALSEGIDEGKQAPRDQGMGLSRRTGGPLCRQWGHKQSALCVECTLHLRSFWSHHLPAFLVPFLLWTFIHSLKPTSKVLSVRKLALPP